MVRTVSIETKIDYLIGKFDNLDKRIANIEEVVNSKHKPTRKRFSKLTDKILRR